MSNSTISYTAVVDAIRARAGKAATDAYLVHVLGLDGSLADYRQVRRLAGEAVRAGVARRVVRSTLIYWVAA